MASIRDLLHKHFDKIKHYSDDELYRYTIMLVMAVMVAVVLLALLIFFACNGSLPLVLCGIAWIALDAVAAVLVVKRHTDIAGVLIAVTIILSSLSAIYFAGQGTYAIFYQFYALLLMLVVPFKSKKISLGFGIVVPVTIIFSHMFELQNFVHGNMLVHDAVIVLSYINLSCNALALVLLAFLQNFVRSVISKFNRQKIGELESQAYLDALTGLYNRRYADMYVDMQDKRESRKAYIAVADIDDFKIVNDTYGHDAGDAVLKFIANVMKEQVGTANPVFRWGGEEFVTIIYDVDSAKAINILETIRNTIKHGNIKYHDLHISVTITIGVADLDFNSFALSFNTADKNLYDGKQSGKNKTIY